MPTLTLQRDIGSTHFTKCASEFGGTYWTSDLSRAQLLDRCRTHIKQADLGGDQETGFEQSFASLAYAFIRDKAPRLLPYAVGFQLVERSEDNDKAAGVFGFKLGKQWLYVPVFFINGDLKGHELLYVKNQDVFVPLKENWVNYIMSRRPRLLGEGSSRDVYQLGGLSPNIERLAWPPTGYKFGGDAFTSMMSPEQAGMVNNATAKPLPLRPAAPSPLPLGGINPRTGGKVMQPPIPGMGKVGFPVDEWAKDFLPLLASCRTKSARFIWRDRQVGEKIDLKKLAAAPLRAALMSVPDLEQFLKKADWRFSALAWSWAQRYPGFKQGCDRFYGPDLFARLAKHHKQASDHAAHNLLATPLVSKSAFAPPPTLFGNQLLPTVKRAAGDAKLKITVRKGVGITQSGPDSKALSDDDKLHVLSHGYLVKDERTGEEVTKVYNVQVRQALSNPDETGIFQILERPGSFTRMLVIKAPMTNDGAADFSTAVRLDDSGNKAWINLNNSRLFADFANKTDSREDYRKWYKGLPAVKTLETDAHYIAVSETGEGTVPFKVRQHYDTKDYEAYKVDFDDSADYDRGRPGFMPITENSPGNPYKGVTDGGPYISSYGAMLIINARPGVKLRAVNGDLHVPTENFKFIKLKSPPKPKKSKNDNDLMKAEAIDCCGECGSDPKPIDPGDIADIQMLFTEKTAEISLLPDHNEVSIFSKAGCQKLGWTEALLHLVAVHGTDLPAAQAMIDTVRVKSAGELMTYRVKYADMYPRSDEGPTAPPFPAPQYGTEPIGYNSVNAIYPQEDAMPVPGMDSSRTDPKVYDPFLNITPDSQTMQAAQTAGQEGQKEVFDTSALTGMLKTTRPESVVDEHLGDFVKALDGVGRILFTLYYHNEDFVDQYSKSEVGDLEDGLRNALESLGDLVIFLRERKVESDLDSQADLNHVAD